MATPLCGHLVFQMHVLCVFHWKRFVLQFWQHLLRIATFHHRSILSRTLGSFLMDRINSIYKIANSCKASLLSFLTSKLLSDSQRSINCYAFWLPCKPHPMHSFLFTRKSSYCIQFTALYKQHVCELGQLCFHWKATQQLVIGCLLNLMCIYLWSTTRFTTFSVRSCFILSIILVELSAFLYMRVVMPPVKQCHTKTSKTACVAKRRALAAPMAKYITDIQSKVKQGPELVCTHYHHLMLLNVLKASTSKWNCWSTFC